MSDHDPSSGAEPGVDYDPFAGVELARVVPTTEAQREIWLADQLSPEASLAYNESSSMLLEGEVDVAALRNAIQDLCDRHDSLRSTIGPDGIDLLIATHVALPLAERDLRAMPADATRAALAAERRRAVELPFALTAGPLIRAVLVSLTDTRHELILTAHHIVCDGWSLGVIARDLMRLYRIRRGNTGVHLPAPASFGDYALARTQPAALRQQAEDEQYWVGLFDGSIPMLDLPCDRPRPAFRTFASRREDVAVDAALTQAVRRFGARNGASLFATLFGVFAGLIGRLSGSDDVVVGVPAAGQAVDGDAELVGHCVNLLPIRLALAAADEPASVLGRARTAVLDAYEHQGCTFGSLLKKLQVNRDAGRLPLVSVLFNLDASIPAAELSDSALRVSVHGNPRQFENFELFLNVSQADDGLVLECQYNTALFDERTVRRWLALYESALRRMTLESAPTLAAALAPSPEDVALLAQFNQTEAVYDRSARIDTLIAQQVAATPDAIAVTSGDTHVSYRDLEARANALALDLIARGLGAGDLVGLACGRSDHMIVALYGILKAGAGYVPLDPAFPPDRLTYMAGDAGLRFVVTDASVADVLQLESTLIWVDALAPTDARVPTRGTAGDVAYMIYTSGSTGRPKGVRVPHGTVVNLLASLRSTPGMTASSAVLSVTTLSFDIAVSEVIMPLTVGARIVVADRRQSIDGDQLRELIEREHVTFIDATPSTWRLLIGSGWQGRDDLLAICTGEPLPPDLGREVLPLVGELWNGYGPTETTVWSTFHRVRTITGPVPIGRPVANTQIHVLDAQLQPLPVGVIGELYIAGDGVTLGYHQRPELTAERFIPDPTAASAGRWYRTGDLGRWRTDGVLECLGRIDQQVKVRGYRIELGEIEANLADHPAVQRVLTITREDRSDDVRIVAYVVPKGAMPDASSLRLHLEARLPEYMIPQHFVELAAIPLLPNGKVDRKALPMPGAGQAALARERVAPRNESETRVIEVMEDVLNLPGLSVLDDFFALGGHSLLAARFVARLNRDFDTTLPLRTVFEARTAEKMAAAVDKARLSGTAKRLPIRHVAGRQVAPLTPMQERIRFVEELHPGRVVYNTPSGHRLRGPMDVALFVQALRQVVHRQPTLRTVIVADPAGQGYLQRVEESLAFEVPFEDLSGIAEADREAGLMRRLQAVIDTPMDIYRAPLFRAALYRLGPDHHAFLFMPHHIIWDGWSFDILYDELSAAYGALVGGTANPLPALPVTYGDFAEWHAEWMRGPEFGEQLNYWKDRFSHVEAPRIIRPDHPRRPGSMSGEGASEWVRIGSAITERLRHIAADADATLNMLTMAVYAAMMASTAQSTSVVIGVPVRGRQQVELESVMGFFNNLLPIQLHLHAEASVHELVAYVKHELLEVMSNQDIPFERLAEEITTAAGAERTGLYQALFSFQDARARTRRWGPLQQSTILTFQKGATEDLGLWLMEVPNGLEGGFVYNADLYTAQTAAAFRDRYIELLERFAADPSVTLAQLLDMTDSSSGDYLRRLGSENVATNRAAAGSVVARRPLSELTPSPVELSLMSVWGELLGVNPRQLRSADTFAVAGGTLVLAEEAARRSEPILGFMLDPRRYMSQTLSQLARAASLLGDVPAVPGLSPHEQALRAIWADLLDVEQSQIAAEDNFFDLGGNSLLAMRAVEQASKALGFRVEAWRYFSESLGRIASAPANAATAAPPAPAVPVADVPRAGLLKRVFGGFGLKSKK